MDSTTNAGVYAQAAGNPDNNSVELPSAASTNPRTMTLTWNIPESSNVIPDILDEAL